MMFSTVSTPLTALWFLLFALKIDATVVCRQQPADIIIMVDGSRSVRPNHFNLIKGYIKEFVDDVDGIGPNHMQIGVVQFSSFVREEIHMNDFTNKEALKRAIDNISYMQMGTMTGEALKFLVKKVLLPARGSRLHLGIPTYAIVLTDGKSQDYFRGEFTQYERQAKAKGVVFFAIGIGNRANRDELHQLASEPKKEHVFHVKTFEDIENVELSITRASICEEDACTSGSHQCEQLCVNTNSSYRCECRSGFILQQDGRSCSPEPVLRVSNLRFTNVTHTTSRVHWNINDVTSDSVHFVLSYVRTGSGGENQIVRLPERTAYLTNLSPSTSYRVEVSAVSSTQFSLPINGTFTTLSLGSTILSLSNSTLTTFVATWTPASGDGLTAYMLIYHLSRSESRYGLESNVSRVVLGANVHRRVITGLEPDTSYTVGVEPRYGSLFGELTANRIKTKRLTLPHVTITGTTLTTLSASWRIRYNYNIRNWQISIYDEKSKKRRNIEVAGDLRNYVFRRLKPNTNHTVEVMALIVDGGRQFRTAKGSARKRTRRIIKPRITASNATATSFDVHWKELNFPAQSWTIKTYPKLDKTMIKLKKTLHSRLSTTFTDLIPNEKYKIEVIGHVIDDGRMLKSPRGKQRITTKRLTAPPVRITDVGVTSFRVNWKDINVPVDDWIVKLYTQGVFDYLEEHTASGNEYSHTFTGLRSNTDYSVGVFGRLNLDGMFMLGPRGSAAEHTAEVSAPTVLISNTTAFSLRASWGVVNFPAASWFLVLRRVQRNGSPNRDEVNGNRVARLNVDGNVRSRSFYNLSPATEYTVEVVAVSGQLRSGTGRNNGRTKSLTTPTVRASETSFGSLLVSWEDINVDVDGWKISLSSSGGDKEINRPGDDNEAEFNELDEGTLYNIRVVGVVSSGNKTYQSPAGEASATTERLTAPTVQVTRRGFSLLDVHWEAINVDVNHWRAVVDTDDGSRIKDEDVAANQRSTSFSDLEQGTQYNIQIIGVVSSGRRSYESPPGQMSAATREATTPSVQISNVTPFALRASWSDVNFPALSWELILRKSDRETSSHSRAQLAFVQRLNVDGNVRNRSFYNLSPATEYTVEVVAVSGQLRSGTGRNNGRTKSLTAPIVRVNETSFGSLLVSWKDINVDVDRWKISLSSSGGDKEINRPGDDNEAEFNELDEGTLYNIRVVGVVSSGNKTYQSPAGEASATTNTLVAPSVDVTSTEFSSLIRWQGVNVDNFLWKITLTFDEDDNARTAVVPGDKYRKRFLGLSPGTPYDVQVVGVLTSGSRLYRTPVGEASDITQSLTAPIVRVSETSFGSLLVSWEDINVDVDGWKISLSSSGGDKEINRPGDDNEAEFNELDEGTLYNIRVVGVVSSGNKTYQSPAGEASATTRSLTAPSVEITDTTISSMNVRWGDINTPVTMWRVTLLDEDGNDLTVISTESNQRVFDNLDEGRTYTVQVVGVVTSGGRTYTSPIGDASASLNEVSIPNVEINNVTAFSLRASWGDVNFHVTSWDVALYTIGDEDSNNDGKEGRKSLVTRLNAGGNVRSKSFYNLSPATEYTVEVVAVSGQLRSGTGRNNGRTKSLTAPTVRVSEISFGSLLVSWEDINVDVDGWKISLSSSGGDEEINRPGDDNEAVFNELDEGTLYNIRVVGVVSSGNKTYQSPAGEASATTRILSRPRVLVPYRTFSTLSVHWGNINTKVDFWNVRLATNDGTVVKRVRTPTSKRINDFEELDEGTYYKVHVTGRVTSGQRHYEVTGNTSATTRSLNSPGVRVIATTFSSLSVRWEGIGVAVDRWEVTLTNAAGNVQLFNRPGDDNEAEFNELDEGTLYNIRVVGVVSSGNKTYQSPAGEASATTDSLIAPTVEISNTTFSVISLRWQGINVPVHKWKVTATAQNGGDIVKVLNASSNQFAITINKLDKGTPYNIRVVGVVTTGGRNYTSPAGEASATTDELTRPSVDVTRVTPFSMTAGWEGINYPVDSWNVVARRIDDENPKEINPVIKNMTVEGDVFEKLFTGFSPDTKYAIEVIGLVGGTRSKKGLHRSKTAQLSRPAPAVDATSTTFSSLSVRWQDINVDVDSWKISISTGSDITEINRPGDDNEAVFNELDEGTLYNIRVVGVVSSGNKTYQSPAGEASATTVSLTAPQVEISSTTFSTLSVRWRDINVDVYGWRVSLTTEDGTLVENMELTQNTNEKVFTELDEGTNYNVQVVGVVSSGNRTYTSPTGEDSNVTKPLTAPIVRVSETSFGSLLVSWEDINVDVDRWVIYLSSSGGDKEINRPGDDNEAEFNELDEGTLYNIRVVGVVSSGNKTYQSPAGEASANTSELTTPRVEVENITPFTLTVAWEDINVPVSTWNIVVRRSDKDVNDLEGDANHVADVPGNVHEKLFTDLDPDTEYIVEVTGQVGSSLSGTGVNRTRTASLESPSVDIIDTTYSTLTVNWEDINAHVHTWRVTLLTDDDHDIIEIDDVGGNETEKVFDNLSEGTEYDVRVIGLVNVGDKSYQSLPGESTETTKSLISISGPMVECVEHDVTSLTLEWSDVASDDVTSWSVNVFWKNGKKFLKKYMLPETSRSLVISDLQPQAVYLIKVAGKVKEGEVTFKTQSGSVNCSTDSIEEPVVSIDHTRTTFSTISIHWSDINAPTSGWNIELLKEDSEPLRVNQPGDDNEAEFNELDEGTLYNIRVVGVVSSGNKTYQSPAGETSTATEPLTAPTVRVSETSFGSLLVSWEDINVDVDGWKISLSSSGGDKEINRPGDDNEAEFNELDEGTLYNIRVVGVVSSGNKTYQSPAGEASATTISLTAPQVEISSTTFSTLSVRWRDINVDVYGWRVSLTTEDGTLVENMELPRNTSEKVFTELDDGTNYNVQVVGVVSSGNRTYTSPTGEDSNVTKSITAPIVRVSETSFGSLLVSWEDINVDADRWVIYLSSSGGDEELFRVKRAVGDNEMVFNELDEGTLYNIRVVGFLNTGRRTYRSPAGEASATTSELTTPRVEVENITPFTLTVAWEDINSPVSTWNIVVRRSDNLADLASLVADVPGNVHEKLFTDLDPDTEYIVEVTGQVGSSLSGTGVNRTRTASLESPSVEIIDTTYSTLTVNWEDINAHVHTWRVTLLTDDDHVIEIDDVGGNESEKVFDNLSEGTEYDVRVIGLVNVGDKSYQSPPGESTETTKSLISISGPMVECIEQTATSLTLEWSDVASDDVTSWSVNVFWKNGKTFFKKYMLPETSRSLVISDLQPQAVYLIKVAGKVKEGEVTFKTQSGSVNCSTDSLEEPVVSIDHTRTTFSTISIHWSGINAPTSGWNIEFINKDSEPLRFFRPGDVSEAVFNELDEGTLYNIRVVGVVSSGNKTYQSPAGEASATTISLTAPQVEISSTTFSTLSVRWRDINVDVYGWRVSLTTEDGTLVENMELPRNTSEKVFTELDEGTNYNVQVVGVVSSGNRTYTSPTGEDSNVTKPLTAPIVRVSETSFGSLLVSWEDINVDADRWVIYLSSSGGDEELYRVKRAVGDNEMVFNELDEGTLYNIRVVGFLNTGRRTYRSPAGEASATTSELTTPRVEVENITPFTLTVAWEDINSPVSTWNIVVRRSDNLADLASLVADVPGNVHEKLFTDLDPDTEYIVEVTGQVGSSLSGTGVNRTRTASLESPSVEIIDTTYSTLTVNWEDINAHVHTWRVTLLTDDDHVIEIDDVGSNETEKVFDNLSEGTEYDVRVIGLVNVGDKSYQSPPGESTETTKSLISISGPMVECIEQTATSLTLEWSDVASDDVTSWSVNVFWKNGKKFLKKYMLPETSRSLVISDLQPQAVYLIKVAGKVKEGEVTFKTQSGSVNCSTDSIEEPVVSIDHTRTTFSTISIHWSDINAPTSGWNIEFINKDSEPLRFFRPGDVSEAVFNELDEGTLYNIRVVGVVSSGNKTYQSPAGEASATTISLTAPQVEISSTTFSTLSVRWRDINVDVYGWRVSLTPEDGTLVENMELPRNTNEKVFTELDEGTNYNVQVVGVVSSGNRTYTSPTGEDSNVTKSLIAPTVNLGETSFGSLLVSWEDINVDVDGWKISLSSSGGDKEINRPGDNNEAVFNELDEGTLYNIRVVGVVSSGNKTYQSPAGEASATTISLTAPQVEIPSTTFSTLSVRWRDINVDVYGWRVSLTTEDGTLVENMELPRNTNDKVFTELDEGTNYNVQVVGIVSSGNRTYTSPTGEDSNVTKSLTAPTVRASETSFGSLLVSWEDINVDVDGWKISLSSSGGDGEINRPGDDNEAEFNELDEGTLYNIRVVGVVSSGNKTYQSPAGEASATTTSLAPPSVQLNSTFSTLLVRWNDVNVDAEFWRVTMETENGTEVENVDLPGSEHERVFTELDEGTTYNVQVGGFVTKSGRTYTIPSTKESKATTSLESPSVDIIDTTYSTLTVNWEDINAHVHTWMVTLLTDDDHVIEVDDVGGNESEKVFDNLSEGTEYDVRVIGFVNVGDKSYQSPPGENTETTKSLISISGPMVECDEQTATSLTLEWSDVASDDVTSWSVNVFWKNGKKFLKKYMLPETSRSLVISDLQPQAVYLIKVAGKVKEGEVTFKTQSGSVNCSTDSLESPVVFIVHNQTTFSSISIQWGDINAPTSGWKVVLTNEDSDAVQVERVNGTERERTFTQLNPETRYTVAVSGIWSAGKTEVEGAAGRDSGVTGYFISPYIACGQSAATNLTVEWFPDRSVDAGNLWFEVRSYIEDDVFQEWSLEGGLENCSHTIIDLQPSSTYFVSIQARNTDGNTTYVAEREETSCETDSLVEPEVKFTNWTPTELVIEWSDINAPVDLWWITLSYINENQLSADYSGGVVITEFDVDSLGEVVKNFTVSGTVRRTKFNGLIPATLYGATVRGVVKDVQSPAGMESTFTSPLSSPSVQLTHPRPASTRLGAQWQDLDTPVDSWIVKLYTQLDGNSTMAPYKESTISNETLDVTFEGLWPGTEFQVDVAGRLGSYTGPFLSIRGNTDPLTPPVVSIAAVNVTSLTVDWKDINAEVERWEVQISPGGEQITAVDEAKNSFTFEDLLPLTTYTVDVIGVARINESHTLKSPIGSAVGKTDSLTPPRVVFDTASATTLSFNWSDINVAVDLWRVSLSIEYQYETGGFLVEEVSEDSDVHSTTFTGLSFGAPYVVEVSGIFRNSTGPPGRANASTEMLKVPRVTRTSVGLSSLTFTWGDVNADVSYWLVTLTSGEDTVATKQGSDKKAIFDNLKPQTTYQVSVIGIVQDLDALAASPPGVVAATTQPLTAPDVELPLVSPTTLHARWSDINMPVDEWIVTLNQASPSLNDSEDEMVLVKKTQVENKNSINFDGLLPDSTYRVEVVGRVKGVDGPPGEASNHTNSLSPPAVDIADTSLTSVTVRWAPINDHVTSWLITIVDREHNRSKKFTVDGNVRESNLEDLHPGYRYDVTVAGIIENGHTSIQSPPGVLNATTNFLPTPILEIAADTPTSMEVRWRTVNTTFDLWTVTIQKIRKNSSSTGLGRKSVDLGGDTHTVTFDSLAPSTLYKVDIVGQVSGYQTTPGQAQNYTKSLTSPQVEVINSTQSSLAVAWKDINTVVSRWIVQISNEDIGLLEEFETDPFDRSKVLNGLKASLPYQVQVVGVVHVGDQHTVTSPPGRTTGRTERLHGPQVTCTYTTINQIVVKWSADHIDNVTYWVTRVFPEGSDDEARNETFVGSQKRGSFRGLHPSTEYVVEVKGIIRRNGVNYETAYMSDTCITRPLFPRNLVVTDRGLTFIRARFDPSLSSVDYYQALCSPVLDFPEGSRNGLITNDFQISCINLDPGTAYKILLQSFYRNRGSRVIRTKNATLTPPPTGLTLLNTTTHTMEAKWDSPDVDYIDRYYVTYNSTAEDHIVVIVNGTKHTLLLTNLKPGTEYLVKVQAEVNDVNSSCDVARETTPMDILDLQVLDIGFTTLNVSWSPSKVSNLHTYILEYFPVSSPDDTIRMDLPTDLTIYLISNLQSAVNYQVTIRANYGDSESPQTRRHAMTLAQPPVGPLYFTNVTESSFVGHWSAPEDAPPSISYVIMYYDNQIQPITVDNVRETFYTFEDLSPATLYNITVFAEYPNGVESPSLHGSETTLDRPEGCSCSAYLRSQAKMQRMLMQMMDKIDVLTQRVEELSRPRSSRIPKNRRRNSHSRRSS